MPLTATQEVWAARAMRVPLSVVQAKTLIPEEEGPVIDDIELYEAKQNSIAVELNGEVDYKTQRLLDAIRDRLRGVYGLPPYWEEMSGSSGSFSIPNVGVF